MISVLLRRDSRELDLSRHMHKEEVIEDTARRQLSASQEESSYKELWTPDALTGTLRWDFLASGNARNKFLLFKPLSLWYFVMMV